MHGGWVTLFVFLLIVLVLHIVVKSEEKSEERKKKRDDAEIAFEESEGVIHQIRISRKRPPIFW